MEHFGKIQQRELRIGVDSKRLQRVLAEQLLEFESLRRSDFTRVSPGVLKLPFYCKKPKPELTEEALCVCLM